jgi:hypothetical protein
MQTTEVTIKEVWDFAAETHRQHYARAKAIRLLGMESKPYELRDLTMQMLILRDIGRIIQGIGPADDDGNPFDPGEIDF